MKPPATEITPPICLACRSVGFYWLRFSCTFTSLLLSMKFPILHGRMSKCDGEITGLYTPESWATIGLGPMGTLWKHLHESLHSLPLHCNTWDYIAAWQLYRFVAGFTMISARIELWARISEQESEKDPSFLPARCLQRRCNLLFSDKSRRHPSSVTTSRHVVPCLSYAFTPRECSW